MRVDIGVIGDVVSLALEKAHRVVLPAAQEIAGAVKANAPGGAGNIPWLLLDIKSREGAGLFSETKGILRVDTQGGMAPADGCDEAHAGRETRVPYTTNYIFLK